MGGGRWRWDLGDWRLLPPGRLMFDAPSVGSGRLINMPMTWPLFLDTPDLLRSPSDLQLEGLYQINESEECNLLLIIVGRLREGVAAILGKPITVTCSMVVLILEVLLVFKRE